MPTTATAGSSRRDSSASIRPTQKSVVGGSGNSVSDFGYQLEWRHTATTPASARARRSAAELKLLMRARSRSWWRPAAAAIRS